MQCADRQMREHGVASFPGSEKLDKQNLMAKLPCEWQKKSLPDEYLQKELQA